MVPRKPFFVFGFLGGGLRFSGYFRDFGGSQLCRVNQGFGLWGVGLANNPKNLDP